MKNKLLLIIVVIEIFALVVVKKPNNNKKYSYVLNEFGNINIENAKLENYIIGVVAAEMPASFSFEALKAQAVASRTFTYNKIINGNIKTDELTMDKGQAYIDKEEMKKKWGNNFEKNYDVVSSAVLCTKGEILTYDNKPINSYYFSISNGMTEDSKNVFEEKPYLISVDSSWDKYENEYQKVKKISTDEFKELLNISDENIEVLSIDYNQTNHIDRININNKVYSGLELRKILGLRSTDFIINDDGNNITITTKGYGHGVGMSQYGANHLAKEGKTYEDILKYYYKDVELTKI